MFMKRKGFSNVVVKVGARASALIALSLAIPMAVALSSCDREEPNCPKKTVKEPKGIEVLIDYEDVATGETTRSLANGRSLGRLGEGFDVEADGLKLYGITYDKSDIPLPINPELTFYAKENVVFQGWSWRYGTDKPGTQRDSKGNIISDYIATPALQPDAGQHKLALSADKTSFTCKYDPNSDNKVYVKVKYAFFSPQLELPELPPLVPDTETVCGYCHREPDYGDCDCPEARQNGTWWIEIEVPNPFEADYASCVREYKEDRTLSKYKKGIDVWNEASNYFLHSR